MNGTVKTPTGLLFSLFLLITVAPYYASAAQPEVTLRLDTDTAEADVSPGSKGIAVLTGVVICNTEGISDMQTVTALLSVSGGFPTTISPNNYVFGPGDDNEIEFEVTVHIPNFTSSALVASVYISGSYTIEPGLDIQYPIPEVHGEITVKPYISSSLTFF